MVILIPVFNGRDSLLRLLQDLRGMSIQDIVVIDDGSSDGLTDLDVNPFTLIRHKKNRGKGAALKTGLHFAHSRGFTHALSMDADGQHPAHLVNDFLECVAQHPRALVVGKRDLVHESMPFHRKLSNNITSLMLSLRTGRKIVDSQVGYRVYPLYDSHLWNIDEAGFQFESAIFLQAARLNIPLSWINVPVIYGSEGSHMHLVKDTLRFVRTYFGSFQC